MELFSLPHTSKVNRVIPKNAFDRYTTAKQKKLFTELISRITWTHKLSPDTINLEAKDIKEIQLFKIELKVKQEIQSLLDIMDKSIPYPIIFMIEHGAMIYLSTSAKHPHPINEDNAVIDWTFKTEWFQQDQNKFYFQLKKNIDAVYHDFCIQLSGNYMMANKPLQELIILKKKVDALEKEIARLKSGISGSKQFNNKVDMNLTLKEAEKKLKELI
jgi:hypothetical protein